MKHLTTCLMLLAAITAAPLQAVSARTYQDALRKANDKRPVVMFCYGANYDKVSEDTYETFVKKRKIMKAVRKAVFLEVPVYQLPTEKEKKEYEKVMGKAGLPGGIWSYPCLAVVDAGGNLRGIVQSADEMKDPESASAALEVLLQSYTEQEKLLKKAVKASGSRQAKLFAQAADIQLNMPKNPLGGGLEKDTIGISARFNFEPLVVVEKLQVMSLQGANTYVRNMISKGCYSRRQRQEIMAAYAGHVRRNGGSANRLRAIYTEMRNIDPKSIYGAYAEGAIEVWVVPMEKAGKDGDAPRFKASGNTAMGSDKLETTEE